VAVDPRDIIRRGRAGGADPLAWLNALIEQALQQRGPGARGGLPSTPAEPPGAVGAAPSSLIGGTLPTPPSPGSGLLDDIGARLNPWRVTPSPEGTPASLTARMNQEQTEAQQRAAMGQLTPEEQGRLAREQAVRVASPEALQEALEAGRSVGPRQENPALYPGPTPVGGAPGAAAGGGSFQGPTGVNASLTRAQTPNAPTTALEQITGERRPGVPGVPGSLTGGPTNPLGLPDVSGLSGSFLNQLSNEGLLAQYQQNPEFAVYDLMSDVGANPRRNVYANYGYQKWAPIFAPLAALAETADPKAKNAYQNFVKAFVGGGDMGAVMSGAVKKALTGGAEGENARTVLTSLGPERLAQMISAQRGESPMAAAARKSSMGMAQMEFMRQAQGRAQAGGPEAMSDDQKAWLEYLLGQV
jgi:hypothetical protein